jgi:hypothetical protein
MVELPDRIEITGKVTVHFVSPSFLRMLRGNRERKAKGIRRHIRQTKAERRKQFPQVR